MLRGYVVATTDAGKCEAAAIPALALLIARVVSEPQKFASNKGRPIQVMRRTDETAISHPRQTEDFRLLRQQVVDRG